MNRLFKILPLFFPLVLSVSFSKSPALSYLTAWVGSFYILYWTISGKVVPLPRDLPLAKQFMRPIVLNQIIFAGFTALSSIFFFLDANGFFFFEHEPIRVSSEYLARIAECQRYYLLSHTVFAAGIVMHMKYTLKQKWTMRIRSYSWFFIRVAILFVGLRTVISFFPALAQVEWRLEAISMMSVLLSFSFTIPEKRRGLLIINSILYLINLYFAFLSGWKGRTLILLILLGVLLYPYFKKRVIIVGVLVIIVWFTFVPHFMGIFRQRSWTEEEPAKEAFKAAYLETKSASWYSLKEANWSFLVGRFSEIVAFLKYTDNVPHHRDYYGFQIAFQSLQSIIPRFLWKDKPDTERLAMERAYENYAVTRGVHVSAKPQFTVDAYLSGGWLCILIACYIYGALASIFSRMAEEWFGGYILGTALIYNSLFQVFWQGSCFEFIANTAFWSFVIMFAIFKFGQIFGFIVPARGKDAS